MPSRSKESDPMQVPPANQRSDLHRFSGGINFVGIGLSVISFRMILLSALFILFVTPLSLALRGGQVSANYAFIFYPLIVFLVGGKLRRPDKMIVNVALLYMAIFFLPVIYQYQYYEFFDRRLFSFAIFMSAFVFALVKIDDEMIKSFKFAVIAIATYQSLVTIEHYFAFGGLSLGYEAKGLVGSQRFGFVLVFAGWLIFLYKPQRIFTYLFKYIVFFIIFNGMTLTFSRASIVAVLGSFALYLIFRIAILIKYSRNPTTIDIWRFIIDLIAFTGVIWLSYEVFPVTFQFYLSRMFDLNITPLLDGYYSYPKFPSYDTYVYNVIESSEGYRFYILSWIVEYIFYNPIFGAGYLGTWIMFPDLEGSAHNQLLDVLFRTGPIGLLVYAYLLYRMLRFLYLKQEFGLFWGVIGILFFGLFHETFKLSQGAFIFAFLIGMTFQLRAVHDES